MENPEHGDSTMSFTGGCLKKLWHSQTMACYSKDKKEILKDTTQMNFKGFTPSQKCNPKKLYILSFHSYDIIKNSKIINWERLEVARSKCEEENSVPIKA